MTSQSPGSSQFDPSPEATADIGPGLRDSLHDDMVGEGLADVEGMAAPDRNSGLLVVKRGPNVGARFVLHGDVATAGRHPSSDIFLDHITVSHAVRHKAA